MLSVWQRPRGSFAALGEVTHPLKTILASLEKVLAAAEQKIAAEATDEDGLRQVATEAAGDLERVLKGRAQHVRVWRACSDSSSFFMTQARWYRNSCWTWQIWPCQ